MINMIDISKYVGGGSRYSEQKNRTLNHRRSFAGGSTGNGSRLAAVRDSRQSLAEAPTDAE